MFDLFLFWDVLFWLKVGFISPGDEVMG